MRRFLVDGVASSRILQVRLGPFESELQPVVARVTSGHSVGTKGDYILSFHVRNPFYLAHCHVFNYPFRGWDRDTELIITANTFANRA